MSLFDDDFYSTKLSKTPKPWGKARDGQGQTIKAEPNSEWTRHAAGWSARDGMGWDGRKRRGWGAPSFIGRHPLSIMIGSLLIGAGLMLFIIQGIDHQGSSNNHQKEAIAVPVTAAVGAEQDSDAVVSATEEVQPSVVSVISTIKSDPKSQDNSGSGMGIGSGVIFQTAGSKVLIITNNHVVQGSTQLDVVMANGEKRKGTLIGQDALTDLAVIEMDGKGITQVAQFGDSDLLKAGQTAIAIGNPLGLGFSQTVTKGVISSPHRLIPVSLSKDGVYDWEEDVIQTDAAINQGNSGGALVDLNGKVIGINSLKIADIGVEGLGFAIPINEVKTVSESLIAYGKVKRPYMGVSTENLQAFTGTDVLKLPSDVKDGIIVLQAQGPALAAGLKSQDVIVELDGKHVGSTIALRMYLYAERKIGDNVKVTYYRDGKKYSTVVVLEEKKD